MSFSKPEESRLEVTGYVMAIDVQHVVEVFDNEYVHDDALALYDSEFHNKYKVTLIIEPY